MIDVTPEQLALVQGILAKHVPTCEVWVFGSRVAGKTWAHSDLDLVVITSAPLSLVAIADLISEFQDSDLPFHVDVLDWARVAEPFRAIIEEQYEVIQPASAAASTTETTA